MPEQLPTWLNAGVEPPESLKTDGWQPGMKPSAQHMNWLFNRAYAVLKELQDGGNISEIEQQLTTLERDLATHKADYVDHVGYAIDSGTANAKVVALNPAPASYVEGMAIAFKNKVQNTGAVTININGLGTKPIVKSNGNALTSGNLKVNSVYTLRYNGVNFILQGEGGEYGTATASDVLAGKTIGDENGLVVGTMPNRGTFNLDLGAIVPAGYYSGGSVPAGKKYAIFNGTFPRSSYGQKKQFTMNFTPTVIFISANNYNSTWQEGFFSLDTIGINSDNLSSDWNYGSESSDILLFFDRFPTTPAGELPSNNQFVLKVEANNAYSIAYRVIAIQ